MNEQTEDINYRVADRDLKYYIFDWDNNILHMPTRIHLLRKEPDGSWSPMSVSTSTFAMIRDDSENYRPPEGDWEKAFVEFRDLDPRAESKFLLDTREALDLNMRSEAKPAPSFLQFKQVLVEGRLFAIVTARGHSQDTMVAAVRYFIDKVLSEPERREMIRNLRGYLHVFDGGEQKMTDEEVLTHYLELNRYHAVMSPEFRARLASALGQSPQPEKAKQYAIKDFVNHIVGIIREKGIEKPISFGFSDDDPINVNAVQNYIGRVLAQEFPQVSFAVYDTSDPDLVSGRKVIVRGQLKLDLESHES